MHGSLSILIVEDDNAARSSLCNLTAMNHPELTIHSADNGQAGLDLYLQHRPEIVVTDISMPVMDGISMAAEIRGCNPEAAIIALTSFLDTRFLLKSIEIGVDHYAGGMCRSSRVSSAGSIRPSPRISSFCPRTSAAPSTISPTSWRIRAS